MTDFVERSKEENERLVLAAASAVDWKAHSSYYDLLVETTRNATKLASILSETSLPMQVLSAVKLRATIMGIAFEESSQRYILTFKVDGAEKEETIRTDRVDGGLGDFVCKMFTEDLVGKEVILYKSNDVNAKKPGQTVRTCHWLQPVYSKRG